MIHRPKTLNSLIMSGPIIWGRSHHLTPYAIPLRAMAHPDFPMRCGAERDSTLTFRRLTSPIGTRPQRTG